MICPTARASQLKSVAASRQGTMVELTDQSTKEPECVKSVKCLNSKGGRNGVEGLQPSLQDRVFETDGLSFGITTAYHPSIIEVKEEWKKI